MEKVVLEREWSFMAAGMSSRASHLVYYIVRRANLSKLLWKFFWALLKRTATTNCRVSFIVLYFLQIKDRIFTPYKHCNVTGIVLWYYHGDWVTCGTTASTTAPRVVPSLIPMSDFKSLLRFHFYLPSLSKNYKRRHQQWFGEITNTAVLDKDENLL